MRITFLGTGDAGGVPLYGCDCPACARARAVSEFRRRPCTALVEAGNTRILLDAGLSDLTERFPPGSLTAIVLTHFHPDHVQGLFHLRWGVGERIPVLGPPDSEGCADLHKNHGLLEFRRLKKYEPVAIGNLTLTPLPLIHSKVTFGYAMEDLAGRRLAYLTDTIGLPPRTEAFLSDWRPEVVALDCTEPPRPVPPRNHNDLTRALAIAGKLEQAETWLTHASHDLDAWLLESANDLPTGINVAHDGLVVSLCGQR
ncbi:MAG: phosphonate metabolism protein PhnP [Gammaproteobacteria bacterium HGW-Gammaproteobacteria-1]|jgi:phosphoribosyl 1,2-cyclic phosphate phosphodiesterase|nr:MAG: phosphonate metabolism protein PhnP [Gammaproteobacteria bacterium HGW-Gammaproteobacteria-1]PKO86544.1 MAG: phosphonate metabolism protein PhnP [Betaproteobacteria bacterium HGW-Betaproteobacteria-12]